MVISGVFGLWACILIPATSFEDSSLVQAHVDLRREPTTIADKDRELVNVAQQLVHEAIRPHMYVDEEGMPVNASSEALMKAAKSLLDAFRDKVFVRTVYQGLQNMTDVWQFFAGITFMRVQSLNATSHNFNASQDAVFRKLHHFWLRHGTDTAQVLAATLASFEIAVAALPDGYLRRMVPGKLRGPDAVYKDAVSSLNISVQRLVKRTFNTSNTSSFCHRMGLFLAHVSKSYLELPRVIKALNKAMPYMPSMKPKAMAVAPDAGPLLFDFVNSSYARASNFSLLLEDVQRNVTSVSTDILVHRLGCDIASLGSELAPFEESGCKGSGLATLLALLCLALWEW